MLGEMERRETFGEHVRKLRRAKRWALQESAVASSLSPTHLSRIENDAVVPNADTVVRLARALGGDLEHMLELADCLPREILERLVRRAEGAPEALRRAVVRPGEDAVFRRGLVEEIDPSIRAALAAAFRLSDNDVHGIFQVLRGMADMPADRREAVITFLASASERSGS
jgi:transcriptional regulator with XRE-family HTH domain